MTARRLASLLIDRGVVLSILALVTYAWLAPSVIVGNDNAEFSTLGATGGIAHPSGYPGYVLWLRLMSWLPGATPAHDAALATVILAFAQLLVLHAAARAWGASSLAATVAVGLYAAAPLVVRYSTEAEAFAPNQLIAALVVWLAARRGPLRGVRRAAVLGVVAGLGMTNHLTCTLVAPIGILGVVRGAREAEGRAAVAVVAAIAGWCLGMTPYLYLFVAPSNALSWPNPTSFGELVDIVLRQQYGGTFGFMGTGDAVPVGAQLRELASSLGRTWWWAGLGVAVATLGARSWRPEDAETRAGWIALAASFVLAGPVLATQFNVEAAELGLHIVHRFHLLPALLLAVPAAVGLTWIGGRVPVDRVRPALAQVLAHLVFVAALVTSLGEVTRYHTPAMEAMVRNALVGVAPNGVVLGTVDELDVGIRYLQLARGERPDVLFFRWRDADVDWYRLKFADAGLVVPPGERYDAIAAIERFHAQGRPVYALWYERELLAEFPHYPAGVLVRLLPRGDRPPSLAEVFALNRELFARYDFDYPLPGRYDEFATWVHRKYAGAWARLAERLSAAGLAAEAATAIELARAVSPQR